MRNPYASTDRGSIDWVFNPMGVPVHKQSVVEP